MKKTILLFIIFFTIAVVSQAQSTKLDFTMQMQQNQNTARIYPNPITEPVFNVTSSAVITNVQVLDMLGKSVLNIDYNDSYEKTHVIKLPDDKKGIYLVKITFDNNQTIIKKLLYQ